MKPKILRRIRQVILAILFASSGILAAVSAAIELEYLSDPLPIEWLFGVRQENEPPTDGIHNDLRAAKDRLRLDPTTPYRWCELAELSEEAGFSDEAREAMDQAVKLGGNLPPVLMRAGNLSFRLGDQEKALRRLSRTLSVEPSYIPLIVSTYSRMGVPLSDVFSRGVPDEEEAQQIAFVVALRWAETQDLETVWERYFSRGHRHGDICSELVSELFRRQLYDKSVTRWAEHLGNGRESYRGNNWISNGGFERELSESPFDWRLERLDGVELGVVPEGRDGSRGLRLSFTGKENLSLQTAQQAAVLASGHYRLSAFFKTEGLTTDEGVYLRVRGMDPAEMAAVRSEAVRSTDGWQQVDVPFTVPAGGAVVEVSIGRNRSLRIDSRIRGTLWIDDMSLERRQ